MTLRRSAAVALLVSAALITTWTGQAIADPVIATAGDIACSPADPDYNGGLGITRHCRQRYTSDLLVNAGLAGVLQLGDNQYESGSLSEFLTSYDPTWGRVKSISHPAVGNHEYNTSGASGYFDYFNGAGSLTGPAGDRGKGYYSFDIGSWHLISLNTNDLNCAYVACGAGSAQEQWLQADLAANHSACTLAYWHHPRFNSGEVGDATYTQAFWQDLYNARADVVLNGHSHDYERFAPQDPNGNADSTNGIREIIVGTGGHSFHSFVTTKANSQVRENATFGVLKLTLHPTSYDWQFFPEAGQTFTDSGTGVCHRVFPQVTIDSVSDTLLGSADTSTAVTWHASQNGTFSVRVGGTSCSTGTQVASGTYSSAPAQQTTTVQASSLQEGANTIRVCVTNTNGDSGSATTTVTKDTVNPQVTIDAVSDSLLGPADASTDVTWHASENGSFSVRVGGTSCSTGTQVASGTYSTAPAQRTTTVQASSLQEGANTIRVCVSDAAANSGAATTSVTKDTTAPQVVVDSVSDTLLGSADTSTSVTWHASENGSFSVRAGGTSCSTGTQVASGTYSSAPAQQSTTVQASSLQEGVNTIRVCVADAAGNSGSATTTVTKDTVNPQVTIDAVSDSLLGPADASTDVTWHASENGSFSVRVGGTSCSTGTQVASGTYSTAPAQRTTTVQATSLQEGANTIRVCVSDAAANSAGATTTVTKDTVSPQVTIDSVSDSLVSPADSSTDITWHASENGAFSVRVGGTSCSTGTQVASGTYSSAPAQQTTTVQATSLQEGANTIRVCVSDAAANSGAATATVTKDTVNPQVTIDSVSDNVLGATETSTDVTWHASESGSFSVRVGGADCSVGTQVASGSYASAPAQRTTTVEATALQEGANTIRVCVTDAAGNSGSTTTTVTKDTSAPQVTIDAVSDSLLGPADSSTDITWHAFENGDFSVRVGGTSCSTGTQVASGTYSSAPAQQSTTVQASSLQEAANTIRVCVTDAAGNSGSTTTTVTKDTSAPQVTVDSVSDNLLAPADSSTDVTWHASENGSFTVRVGTSCLTGTEVDSGVYSDAPAQHTTTIQATDLQEGANTIRVCVADAASNSGFDTTTITKDTLAPQVTIDSVSDDLLGQSDPSTDVTWHSSEDGSFSVRVGGTDCTTGTQVASGTYSSTPAQHTTTIQATDLPEGANTIRVCVTDAASNSGFDTTTITKDTAAPQVVIDTVSDSLLGPNDTSTDVTWHSSRDGTYSVRVGGTDCTTGAQVASGTYSSAPTGQTTSVQVTDLQEGANTIRVCVSDIASNSGFDTTTITKDTTAPQVTIDSVSDDLLGPGDTSTDVTWHSSENGAFSVRVGGTGCGTGTEVDSGSYTQAPDPHTTTVDVADLEEGPNTIRVCVADAATNTGSDSTVVSKLTVTEPADYSHPVGASPLRVPLVPAYQPCEVPAADSTHGTPLDFQSCSGPRQRSSTVTIGRNSVGFARWVVCNSGSASSFCNPLAGGLLKPDVRLTGSIRDVACRTDVPLGCSAGGDYDPSSSAGPYTSAGDGSTPAQPACFPSPTSASDCLAGADLTELAGLSGSSGTGFSGGGIRITDRHNGPTEDAPGTVVDVGFPIPIDCMGTSGDPSRGSNCGVNTTANALLPGAVRNGDAAVWQVGQIELEDSGIDGVRGNEDDELLAVQGIFLP